MYKSKDGERLILYFKDVNLVKPDKWGTCQLVEFIRQVNLHNIMQKVVTINFFRSLYLVDFLTTIWNG